MASSAVLQLQRSAGNRAVSALISKDASVARAGGGHLLRTVAPLAEPDGPSWDATAGSREGAASTGSEPAKKRRVINPRIDVRAQFAFLRLLKSGDPEESQAAGELFDAVEGGAITGIYGDDLALAAKLAKQRQTVRWKLVPGGSDAVVLDDGLPGAPVLIFREQAGSRPRLDRALVTAWRDHHRGTAPRLLEKLDRLDDVIEDVTAVGGGLLGNLLGQVGPQGPGGKVTELDSWVKPTRPFNGIGMIHFATRDHRLSADDKQALKKLAVQVDSVAAKAIFPVKISFQGFADLRDERANAVPLSRTRGRVCREFFLDQLSAAAKKHVKADYFANGNDLTLMGKYIGPTVGRSTPPASLEESLALQRAVVIWREGDPLGEKKVYRPAANRREALAKLRGIVDRRSQEFPGRMYPRALQVLDDKAVDDRFLPPSSELTKIAHGMEKSPVNMEWANRFADQWHVYPDRLQDPMISGPDADEDAAVERVQHVVGHIQQGIGVLGSGAAKDTSGDNNGRRISLTKWIEQQNAEPASVYYKWGIHSFGKGPVPGMPTE